MLSAFEPYADHDCLWELQRRRPLTYCLDDMPPRWTTTDLGFERLNALGPGLGDRAKPYVTPMSEILKP